MIFLCFLITNRQLFSLLRWKVTIFALFQCKQFLWQCINVFGIGKSLVLRIVEFSFIHCYISSTNAETKRQNAKNLYGWLIEEVWLTYCLEGDVGYVSSEILRVDSHRGKILRNPDAISDLWRGWFKYKSPLDKKFFSTTFRCKILLASAFFTEMTRLYFYCAAKDLVLGGIIARYCIFGL